MANLPDVYCYIKLLSKSNDRAFLSGEVLNYPIDVIVRYVAANDSHVVMGPFTVVGALAKNGQRITPPGQPNVVPSQQITLQPNQVQKWEFEVTDAGGLGLDTFVATMIGDVGNFVDEEAEYNNSARATFEVIPKVT